MLYTCCINTAEKESKEEQSKALLIALFFLASYCHIAVYIMPVSKGLSKNLAYVLGAKLRQVKPK